MCVFMYIYVYFGSTKATFIVKAMDADEKYQIFDSHGTSSVGIRQKL